MSKSSREHILIRQTSLKVQSVCKICTLNVGLVPSDIRLGCECLIHADCLANYIKSKLGDKESIINPLNDHEQIEVDDIIVEEAIICPYYQKNDDFNECNYKYTIVGKNDKDDKYFLTTTDVHFLVNTLKSFDDIILTEDDIVKLESWLSQKDDNDDNNNEEENLDDPFILATTKPCPCIIDKKTKKRCNFRATHPHLHHCHHISPSGGCPSCKHHYCYRCNSCDEDNLRLRGDRGKCVCGGWSNFCSNDNIFDYLRVFPYPHDTRCGCIICFDCKKGSSCAQCDGNCLVCRGIVSRGPEDLKTPYNPDPTGKQKLTIFDHARMGNFHAVKEEYEKSDGTVDINLESKSGLTILYYSVETRNEDLIKLVLLQYKADVNKCISKLRLSQNISNCNVLMYATYHGLTSILKILLSKDDVNVNIKDSLLGVTAGMIAIMNNQFDCFSLLLKQAKYIDVNISDINGKTIAHLAANHFNGEYMKLLLERGDVDINRDDHEHKKPITYAVEKNSIPVIKLLLSYPSIDLSVEIDVKDGNNAMHYLSYIHDHQIIRRVMNKVDIVNKINVLNKQHQTPLITSIMNNNLTYTDLLLSSNADINICDSNGENCLTLACSYDFVDILRTLLKYGNNNVNDKNENFQTPIQTCALKQSNECALELLKLPNIDISNTMHLAAKQGNSVLLKALLSYSSDSSNITSVDDNGSTALHLAAEKGDIICIEVLLSQPGIQIDKQNKDGNTSLHVASMKGSFEAFHYLLSRGASLTIQNNDRLKPLEVDVTKRLVNQYSKQILHSTKNGNIASLKGIVIVIINHYLNNINIILILLSLKKS